MKSDLLLHQANSSIEQPDTEEQKFLQAARSACDAAAEELRIAQAQVDTTKDAMDAPFSASEVYWVEGCCASAEVLINMATEGFPLRAVLLLQKPPETEELANGMHPIRCLPLLLL